uniref:Uncharacterized protein n=1 Tax=Cacopsylla melanoneura TaxID=428564 RepID=A0A8D8U1X7_9HEMI
MTMCPFEMFFLAPSFMVLPPPSYLHHCPPRFLLLSLLSDFVILILPSSCAVLHAMLYVRNYSLISCIYCFVFSAVGMFVANSTAVSSLECLRLLKLIMLQCASHFMLSREFMRIFKRYMHEHYFHDIGGDTGISNSTLYQVNQQTCKECHTRANWQCPAWLRFQVYCLQAELFGSFRFCCCHS